MKISGKRLRMLINEKVVGCSTSCTLHAVANLENSDSKDDEGDWVDQDVVSKAWDGSIDALAFVDPTDEDCIQFDDPFDLIGTVVDIHFTETTGEKNRTVNASTGKGRYGKAIVNDVSANAPNGPKATYTISITGKGPLLKGHP